MSRALLLLLPLFFVTACAGRPALPSGDTRPFVLERDLAGKTRARGTFSSITGDVRGFTAYLDGTWDGETLTLIEDFDFDDGEKDRKTWRLSKTADGRFVGTREDVIGEAEGFYEEGAFRLEYIVRLGDGGRKVKFRDILYKRADEAIVNEATVGYWGLRVGRVRLLIEREGAAE